ncbi:hypothetical protein [Sinorhizobium americanum]|uniref:Uncharacterized protein n=1 Tax=Sinorhizobium americanum TaxID=194963 RepID=A0A1L3LUC7_9HYPH|nr:hypothetical protein [Sinorhizobium americanum]APG87180.1 hypothetical protein SAMCCGM7_pB0465 [Sinorhizobium americanum CCGM7]APG93695.1 hypothetical protein SAMCFNEI73_pB0499 [Sinorhizobium americanum]OAP48925.1 hypothetical protein ATC00_12930 [Sinorhizobium americanum]
MSSLSVYLQKYSVDTSMGAVATLQQLSDDKGNPVRGTRTEVTIPANNHGNANSVDVAPGRWLVEATLPSGEIITTEVAVEKDEDLSVPLHSVEHSPHEWLGMQYLVGNIEGEQTLQRLSSRKSTPESAERDMLARNSPPVVRFPNQDSALRGAAAWQNVFKSGDDRPAPQWPLMEDSGRVTWLYHAQGIEPRRHLARVEWMGEDFAVSLPLPWMTVRFHNFATAEIMVGLEPRENKIRIGVVVSDPDFAPMAGLMTAATLPKAAIAFDQARDLLFGKGEHPLAATAGAYVLLAAGRQEGGWHGWVDNLAKRFPEIPDGAILRAALRLRFPKTQDSSAEAKASLLEAFDRGIPYYSAGISWLLDGLSQFVGDPAVDEKLRLVHKVALRLDVSQAFTVIRTTERGK